MNTPRTDRKGGCHFFIVMKIFADKEKGVVYTLICLGCVTISFNVAAITAAIPVMSRDLGLSSIVVSKVIPYYMIPYGIGALIYAPLTKFFSYRRIISLAMAVFSASCFVCAKADAIGFLLGARVVMGVSGACAIPLGLMIIGESFDKSIRGRLVGLFFGCSFFASLSGLAVSGVGDWRWLFLVPAVLALVLAAFCYVLPLSTLKRVHGVDVNYWRVFDHTQIRNIFLFICVISALYHGVHKWFGIFLDEVYGLDKLTISGLFILAAVAGFSGQILGGVLSDKKGRRFSTYLGIIGLAGSTFFLAGQYTLIVSCLAIILMSMFWTIGHNGISTVLTDFPDKHRPVIASLNSSVRFIAGGLGFYVSRFFVEKSFGATFLVISVLMALLSFTLKKVIEQ